MNMNIDKRIEYHLSQIDRLEQKRLLAERFGSDSDYPDETVIFFKRNFGRMPSAHERGCAIYEYSIEGSICTCREANAVRRASRAKQGTYTYVAIKLGNMWWLTGAGTRMPWNRLVEEHLIRAEEETGEVWFASEWKHL